MSSIPGKISPLKKPKVEERNPFLGPQIDPKVKKMADTKIKQLEELFSPKFDKELDKIILSKMQLGKSDDLILSELLSGKKQLEKNEEDALLFNEIKEKAERELQEKSLDPSKEKLKAHIRELDQTKEILESSNDLPLPELPIHEHLNPKRKLTKNEKKQMELRSVMKSIEKQREMSELLNKANNQLENFERIPAVKSQNTIPSLEKMKLQSSLVSDEKDREIKEMASSDLHSAAKELDTYVKPPKEGDRVLSRIQEKLPTDSFEKAKNKLKRLEEQLSHLDVDREFLEDLVKEDIFRERELQEERERQKKRLEMKMRMKEMRKMDDELHRKPQKEDLDYQDFLNKKSKKKAEDPWLKMYLKVPPEAAQIESDAKTMEQENPYYERFAMRTLNNVKNFLHYFFSDDKRSLEGFTKGLQICLIDVIPNNALTVFNVIWDIDDLTKDYAKKLAIEGKLDGELENLQNRLFKRKGFIAGKLCRTLGMKYAPDLRFFLYKKQKKSSLEIEDELRGLMPDIVKEELRERAKSEGISLKITKGEFKKLVEESYDKIHRKMLDSEDYVEILNEKKSASKFDENGKRIRNNRDETGAKKKYKKKGKSLGFWGERL